MTRFVLRSFPREKTDKETTVGWQWRSDIGVCLSVTRPLCRAVSGAFGRSAPPSSISLCRRERSRSPQSRGQLVAYSCLSVYVHSLPPSVDPPLKPGAPAETENPPLPRGPREKMVAALRPRYFYCAIRIVLMRQIPDGTFFFWSTHTLP